MSHYDDMHDSSDRIEEESRRKKEDFHLEHKQHCPLRYENDAINKNGTLNKYVRIKCLCHVKYPCNHNIRVLTEPLKNIFTDELLNIRAQELNDSQHAFNTLEINRNHRRFSATLPTAIDLIAGK